MEKEEEKVPKKCFLESLHITSSKKSNKTRYTEKKGGERVLDLKKLH